MRSALVDNATLQSAMRVEGRIPFIDSHTMTGDILSLENLIQAVLFYDKVFYLSKGHLPKSKEVKPFLRKFYKINLEEERYRQLADLSNHWSYNLIPCIEGGKLTSDNPYRHFLESLNIDLEFVWEKRNRIYYFTYHMFQKSCRSNLTYLQELLNMACSELMDKSFCREIHDRGPLLYDGCGQIINALYQVTDEKGKRHDSKISPQLIQLYRVFNYLVFRSIFYTAAGGFLGSDLVLSPLRSNLQLTCLFKDYLNGTKGLQTTDRLAKRIAGSGTSVKKEVDQPILFVKMLPMFLSWMAERTTPDQYLNFAWELREEKEFVLTRLHLSEVETMLKAGQRKDAGLLKVLLTEIDQQMEKIREKYQNKQTGKPLYTLTVTLSNLDGTKDLPAMSEMGQGEASGDCHYGTAALTSKFGVVKKSIKDDLARRKELELLRSAVMENDASPAPKSVIQT